MALSITNDNLSELLSSSEPLVIDFWAEWCGPCRMVAPIIDELSSLYAGKVNIGKCDVGEEDELATKYSVHHIPTILFIKGGEVVEKHVGAATRAQLVEKVENLLK
ncbi:MAG: thioredoxin [Rikenellaceae bacterium]